MKQIRGDDALKAAALKRMKDAGVCMGSFIVKTLNAHTSIGARIEDAENVDVEKARILQEIPIPMEVNLVCREDDVRHITSRREALLTEAVEKYARLKKILGFVLEPNNRNENEAHTQL